MTAFEKGEYTVAQTSLRDAKTFVERLRSDDESEATLLRHAFRLLVATSGLDVLLLSGVVAVRIAKKPDK
jgi:hypothetical protein